MKDNEWFAEKGCNNVISVIIIISLINKLEKIEMQTTYLRVHE